MPIFSTLRIKLPIPLSDPWVTSLTTRIRDLLLVTDASSEVSGDPLYWIDILLQIKILDSQHEIVVRKLLLMFVSS